MKIQRHHTKSGSVYDFVFSEHPFRVRRMKLGEAHFVLGPSQVERRINDSAGLGVWRPFKIFYCGGVGDRIHLTFGDDENLYTSYVTSIEHLDVEP